MATEFMSDGMWARLRQLARAKKRRAYVAVPFIGAGAAKRLPLRSGDVLVTKFDAVSVRAGHVHPREIVQYIKRGVEVHSVANLHAKVYVFGRVAIVGSANVSATSETQLVEAGCECRTAKVVADCRAFVLGLRGEVVEPKFARSLIPLWQPPKTPYKASNQNKSKTVQQSDLTAVALDEIDYDEADNSTAAKARESAKRKLVNSSRFRLDHFRWEGSLPKALQRRTRVLMCTRRSGVIRVAAPARVLEVRRYRSARGATRYMVVVESRKYLRELRLADVLKTLGAVGRSLRSLPASKPLRNATLVYQIGKLWPTA